MTVNAHSLHRVDIKGNVTMCSENTNRIKIWKQTYVLTAFKMGPQELRLTAHT